MLRKWVVLAPFHIGEDGAESDTSNTAVGLQPNFAS